MNGSNRLCVLSLTALLVGAVWAPAQEARPWAEKIFTHLSHDFGNVARGSQLVHKFPCTNPYAVPLDFLLEPSCRCVRPSARPARLGPKQTGYIEAMMDTRIFTGPKTVIIRATVSSGQEFTSTCELRLSANSRSDVVFNPGEASFGTVLQGQTPTQVIDVEYAGTLNWQVTGALNNDAPLDISYEEFYRQQNRNGFRVGYRVKIALKPTAPVGDHKWEVFLRTNDPASQLVPFVVSVTIHGSLTITPSTLSLGTMQPGQEVVRRVLIRGNKPFRLVGIEGLGDGVTAELPPAPSPVQALILKCKPGKPGDIYRQLVIKTDLPDAPSVPFRVEGKVQP